MKYSQSYIYYFIKFNEIDKLGTLIDFSKFENLREQVQIELLIWWWGLIMISMSTISFVVTHLYRKFYFSIFWNSPAFLEFFVLLFLIWQDKEVWHNFFEVLTHRGCWELAVYRGYIIFSKFSPCPASFRWQLCALSGYCVWL